MVETAAVGSLWLGGRLGHLERLCLASYLAAGHEVLLFSDGPVADLPDGVQLCEARDIWDFDADLLKQTAPSFIADIFRLHLLQQTDVIWIDTDSLALKTHPVPASGYLVGWYHNRTEVNTGVLRLPRNSPAMQKVLDQFADPGFVPPWLRPALQSRLRALDPSERRAAMFHARRSVMGPFALTPALIDSGEIEHALDEEVLFPIPLEFTDLFFNPHGGWESWITGRTLAIHLFTSAIRKHHKNNPARQGSLIADFEVNLGLARDGA